MKKLKFSGGRYELQQVIKKLNGVSDTEHTFHCIHKIWNVSKPSGISFRFDCTVTATSAGLDIHYRVRPTAGTLFLPALLLLVLAACMIAAVFYGESWLYSVILFVFTAISMVTLACFQQKCTRRFLNAFKNQKAQKNGSR